MSEFGKGLGYCLGLFLCHSERKDLFDKETCKKLGKTKEEAENDNASMWFYVAADHIFDLQIPNNLPKKLKERLSIFSGKVMGWRLPMDIENNAKKKDMNWAIQEAKDLLLEIDKFNGIKAVKGDWQ